MPDDTGGAPEEDWTRAFDLGDSPLVVVRCPLSPALVVEDLYASTSPLDRAIGIYNESSRIRAAIMAAAPDLAANIECDSPPPTRRTKLRLFAMLLRMSYRATPFGLLAAVGLCSLGDATTLGADVDSVRVRGRLDASWVRKLIRQAWSHTSQRDNVRAYANPLILRRGGRLYFEAVDVLSQVPATDYKRGSIRASPLVDSILSEVRAGSRFDEVVDRVATAPITEAHVRRAWSTMLDAGVLLPDCLANPCQEPIEAIGDWIVQNDDERGPIVRQSADALSRATSMPTPDELLPIINRCRALQPDVRSPVHFDTVVPIRGTLNARVIQDAKQFAYIFQCLGSTYDELHPFNRLFFHKFEGFERVEPLLVFLGHCEDQELFGNFSYAEPHDAMAPEAARLLERCVTNALRSQNIECVLSDEDMTVLRGSRRWSSLPPDFDVVFQLFAPTAEDIDRGNYVVAPTRIISTGAAGSSISRFGDVSPEIRDAISAFHRNRAQEVVEVVYNPPRDGHLNVLARPLDTSKSIEFHVAPPSSSSLSLERLFVTMRGGRLILWSDELRRYVRPVETTAYATHLYGPTLARFLRALARDGTPKMVAQFWPNETFATFTPRLRYGRIILSWATWRFAIDPRQKQRERNQELSSFIRQQRVPHEVLLVNKDRAIPLDLHTDIGRELLFELTNRNDEVVVLQERIEKKKEAWLASTLGRHTCEFVVSFQSRADLQLIHVADSPTSIEKGRIFAPLSEWTYVRWYAAPIDRDRLVGAARRMRDVTAENVDVDDWHVLHYRSPDFHTRVRLHTSDGVKAAAAVSRFSTALMERGEIQRFEFATYDPEYERYGGASALRQVEHFFTESSVAAARMLSDLKAGKSRLGESVKSFLELVGPLLTEGMVKRYLAGFTLPRRPLTLLERRAVASVIGDGRDVLARAGFGRSWSALVTPSPRVGGASTFEVVLPSLVHLHMNRCGLSGENEKSALYVQWHVYRAMLSLRWLQSDATA